MRRGQRAPHAVQQGPFPWEAKPDLRALAEAIPASYRGPWRWHGYTSGPISLATVRMGLKWVMRFRRLGTQDAQPMFPEGFEDWHDDPTTHRCGHMVPASERTVQEVSYREDVVDIDSPFARWLAAATPAAVLALLDERDRLWGDLSAALTTLAAAGHFPLPDGYCAACEGQCIVPAAQANTEAIKQAAYAGPSPFEVRS